MKLLKDLLIIIVFVLLFGLASAFIDYSKVTKGTKPVFSICNYNKSNKFETYRGLFHQIDRKCSVTNDESISDSKSISYKIFGSNIKLDDKLVNQKEFLKITTTTQKKCSDSVLVYADKDIKIYTYCLDNINLNSFNKDYSLIEYIKKYKYTKLLNNFTLSGVSIDKNSLELIDNKNISNEGLKIIQCDLNSNTDIYIGLGDMVYQEDFCTNKDDDFDFMWTIKDINDYSVQCEQNAVKEVLYEDEKNSYQFDCERSSKIFVNTPAVRGKEEVNIPIKEALSKNLVTINEAIKRGLKVNTVSKENKQ